MPYSAEPAVSGTATTIVSIGDILDFFIDFAHVVAQKNWFCPKSIF
jgi:hypothetical protein